MVTFLESFVKKIHNSALNKEQKEIFNKNDNVPSFVIDSIFVTLPTNLAFFKDSTCEIG